MDYKAKYENLINILKSTRNNEEKSGYTFKSVIDSIMTELSESEDEKIRKELIEALKQLDREKCPGDSYPYLEWASWLGKRGEQKSVEWDYPYGENETVDKLIAIAECLEMDEDFMYNGYTGTECVKFLRDLARKQVECKPVDKVEPKFKVGDWVMLDRPVLITKDEDMPYNTHQYWTSDGTWFGDANKAKLWTIQDAKDGDVLYHKSPLTGIEYIVMSRGVNGYGAVDSYFRYNSADGFDTNIPSVFSAKLDDITPATKEQCDLLFQKMKEAGYEWDAEKKELKKIESKTAWSEKYIADVFEKVGLAKIVREQRNDQLTNAVQSAMIELSKQQKPTEWSDEEIEALNDVRHLNPGLDSLYLKLLNQ